MPRPTRLSVVLASLLLVAAAAGPTPEALRRRYRVVLIDPTETSAYLATISARFEPFILRSGAFRSEYAVGVFPFFFYDERGEVTIPVSDDALRRVDRGETIRFSGYGSNEAGQQRRFEGQLIPTGPAGGRINIRVHVSRRIAISFRTTYSIPPSGSR